MATQGGKPLHQNALITIVIGLVVIGAIATLNHLYPHALGRVQLATNDWRLYHLRMPKPTGQVVIARIDDESIKELGRWPWNRKVEARLVNALAADKAAVIGFDLLLSERDPADVEREQIAEQLRAAGVSDKALAGLTAESNDAELAQAIKAQGDTYLGYAFSSHELQQIAGASMQGYLTEFLKPPPVAYSIVRKSRGAKVRTVWAKGYLPPIPSLNAAARGVAYVDIDADSDGAARSYPAVVEINGRFCVPLFLALADAYAGHAPLMLSFNRNGVAGIRIAGSSIPVDEIGRMMVHFRGKAGTIPSYSIADIVASRIPPGALAGKIVIVGVTGHGLGDRWVTPMGGDFPGVEILASAVDNVLAGDFVTHNGRLAFEEEWFAGIPLGIAVSIAAALMSAFASAVVAIVLLGGYIGYATYLLRESGELLGIIFPLVTIGVTYTVTMSWRYFTEGAEKRYIRHAFEHYLHPDVIASLVDSSDGLKLGGERCHLSVLFSDIVGFTTRAERSEAEPLVALLNTYTTVMTNLVLESGGVVDKLMGDGLMAFWGPPLNLPDPAQKAVDCALRMFEELEKLAARDERFRDLRIGIGICTGEAIVGNFGGERSFSYSVIGDTVNLASRLEGLTRQFKVNLLVNQQTVEEAGDGLIVRPIGRVRVKGKHQLVQVEEVIAREGNGTDGAYYRRFAEAISQLHSGKSPEAALRAMLEERPDDHVIAMCLERLQAAAGQLPAEMVFEFDTK
ncbi:MAG TPA: adenylate/guanylate cyclase domain-containing protein [Candidatus Binataceae bacterium]|nr:adenylate/guanylate cyclase domain-containing protein [Candidatus Binataceae bacterium]